MPSPSPSTPARRRETFLRRGKIARQYRPADAFTLVEMIVSMGILTILSLLLITMLNQVTASWNQVEAQISTRQNGRSVLTMMASDLRLAALPKDIENTGDLQFLIDPSSSTGGYNNLTGANNPAVLNPHAMFWQAPIATSTVYGIMAEVGYFVEWDTNTWDTSYTGPPRPILCRFFVNPTSDASVKLHGTSYLLQSTPKDYLTSNGSTGTLDLVAPGTGSSNYTGWAADNVLGLWVRALDANGYPITKNAQGAAFGTAPYAFDSRQGYTDHAGVQKTAYTDTQSSTGTQVLVAGDLPYYVDIAVMVIDSRTATRITTADLSTLQAYTVTSPAKFWSDINTYYTSLPAFVQQSARIYSTRVQLVNAY